MTFVSEPDGFRPAIAGCLEACRRCESLIDCVTAQDTPTDAYAAIGPHLRHCLDHFVCLLRGLDSGLVDYDERDRESEVESDPQHFRSILGSVARRLGAIDPATSRRRLRVRQAAAPATVPVVAESNLARELVFLSGHTIHHLAIMKLLAEAHGVAVPERLDVAFSTEAYQKRSESASLPRTG